MLINFWNTLFTIKTNILFRFESIKSFHCIRRNKEIFILLFLFVLIITGCSNDSQQNAAESEENPDFTSVIAFLESNLDEEAMKFLNSTFGRLDSLRIVSEIRGGSGFIKAGRLSTEMKNRINQYVPIYISKDNQMKFDSSLLLTLYLLRDKNEFYGFVQTELNSKIFIERTGKSIVSSVWEDILPFKVDGDPTSEINRIIDIQAKKFSAIWVIINTER